jgi:hypothetical protein
VAIFPSPLESKREKASWNSVVKEKERRDERQSQWLEVLPSASVVVDILPRIWSSEKEERAFYSKDHLRGRKKESSVSERKEERKRTHHHLIWRLIFLSTDVVDEGSFFGTRVVVVSFS